MWHLYFFMSILTAGIVLKLVHPLMGRGVHRHLDAVTRNDRRFVYVLVAVLPVAALALYLWAGRPDMRGAPVYVTNYMELGDRHYSMLAKRPLEILLEQNGEDAGALISLAQINYNLKNYEDAARYFGAALEIAKRTGDWRTRPLATALGESQVEMAGGTVTPEAKETFDFILTMHPENPLARHYLALYKAQAGDLETAVAEWSRLLNEGPSSEPYWKVRVRQNLARAREELRSRNAKAR